MAKTRLTVLDGEQLDIYSTNNTYRGIFTVNSSGQIELTSNIGFSIKINSTQYVNLISIAGIIDFGLVNNCVLGLGASSSLLDTQANNNIYAVNTASLVAGPVDTFATIFGCRASSSFTSRGWVFRRQDDSTNVASISAGGTAWFLKGLNAGGTADPGSGIISAATGFRINNAATSGKILRADGTNYIASSFTIPDTYTTGDILYVSATNVLSKLAIGSSDYALKVSGGIPAWGPIALDGAVVNTLDESNGGTGNATYAIGDILYASAATTLSRLADVATGNALISGGITTAPSWGKIGLTTHISGTLGIGNGGTNATSFGTSNALVYYDGTSLVNDSTIKISSSNLQLTNGILDSGAGVVLAINTGSTRLDCNTASAGISNTYIYANNTLAIQAQYNSVIKVGFFGAVSARASAYTQTYSTASKTVPNLTSSAVSTTASTNTTPFGYTTAAQADAIVTAINALRTDVDNAKQALNSVIDDLQAYGLFQ